MSDGGVRCLSLQMFCICVCVRLCLSSPPVRQVSAPVSVIPVPHPVTPSLPAGKAKERALALAMGVGCGHMFHTTFEKEVSSDLTGERCVLMGMLQGAFKAQYDVLREAGHSPSEAYNETIEEALCSLYPLVAQNGMDWMYANCSTTAQRGALDWAPKFEAAIKPVVQDCYNEVLAGREAARSIQKNSEPDYREKLEAELAEIADQEMWIAGRQLRPLRPENQ